MKPYYDHAGVTIYHGDCLEVMRELESGSVDAVVTDPPYNYGKKYGEHTDDMTTEAFEVWLRIRFEEASRVLKDGGVAYFTCSTQMMAMCEAWPFFRFRQWLVWHRPNLINVHAHSDWKQTWEPIYYGGKGSFRAKKGVFPDSAVFTVAAPQSNFTEGRQHVCQRPVRLITAWLARIEGDSLLDPFMGSGTNLLAAKNMGFKSIGIELEERYCEIAVKRLAQEVLSLN